MGLLNGLLMGLLIGLLMGGHVMTFKARFHRAGLLNVSYYVGLLMVYHVGLIVCLLMGLMYKLLN